MKLKDWVALSPDQHESLAACRVRLGELQEHLGKTMRAVAIEEEQDVERVPGQARGTTPSPRATDVARRRPHRSTAANARAQR